MDAKGEKQQEYREKGTEIGSGGEERRKRSEKTKRWIKETDCKRTDRTADIQEVDGSMDAAHRRYILTDERTQRAR